MKRSTLLVLLFVAAVTFAPEVFACAVCGDVRERNRIAFAWSTAALSLIPLGFIAGIVWWVRCAARRTDPRPID